jgi:hypothetical protein
MEEVPEEVATIGKVAGCSLASALAAGAALLSSCPSSASWEGPLTSPGVSLTGNPRMGPGPLSELGLCHPSGADGMMGVPEGQEVPLGDPSMEGSDDLGDWAGGPGCTARVRFRFVQRPEWLRPGARLIVRDPEDGGTAGAGVIEHVLWDPPSAE